MILKSNHGFVVMGRFFFLLGITLFVVGQSAFAQRTHVATNLMVSMHKGCTYSMNIADIDSLWFTTLSSSYLSDEVKYPSYVRKSIQLRGKKVAFFGDSIMKGFINGNDVTPDNVPNLLNTMYALKKCDNYAVGGSTFLSAMGRKTVMEQVAAAPLAYYDVIVVAAGVNDWALGGDITLFEAAVKSLCDYFSGVNADVVFITPINCADGAAHLSSIASLQIYRNIIYKVILEANKRERFSVIQGGDFGFPDKDGSSELIELMFGDKLHPSEVGYRTLYLSGFIKAINQ